MTRIVEPPVERRTLESALGVVRPAMRRAAEERCALLVTSIVTHAGRVVGARQRGSSAAHRRATTGTAARIDNVALHHVLVLPSVNALATDASMSNLLNRNVRGFLKGYTRAGVRAHYFGREFISFDKRPGAVVGYEVDKAGVVAMELFVGWDSGTVEAPDAAPGIAALVGATRTPEQVVDRVHEGVARQWGAARELDEATAPLDALQQLPAPDENARVGRVEVPIGIVEVFASADRVVIRDDALCATPALEALEASFTETLVSQAPLEPSLLSPLHSAPLLGARPEDYLEAFSRALNS